MTVQDLSAPDKETLRRFFDGIASGYDQINSLLSFSLDQSWRKRAARMILNGKVGQARILDLGVGTGKFLNVFLKKRPWQLAVGVDFAAEMLGKARQALPASCRLLQADIHDLPFAGESFDFVVSSFTLRSVKDRGHFFEEVRRILRPGGKVGFLCLTRPASFAGRALYAPYLKFYLPFMGGLLSSSPDAYRFLSESIQTFPSPQEVGGQLESLGFCDIALRPFTFGISTLIKAVKK